MEEKAPAGPKELYDRAREDFISGRYAQARRGFFELASAYPEHHLVDNALYWAGETWYSVKEYGRALEVFLEAADKYPEGNKAPDSTLKAALSYLELGEPDKAEAKLREVMERFPDTGPAMTARRTLENL